MGRDKATLPFGPEPLLGRMVRILAGVASPLVVVAAPAQTVPPLPPDVRVVRDRREARGPLEGLRAGLAAVADTCDSAFVCACDAPLLVPALVPRLGELVGECDVAVPRVDGRFHPLAALYRPRVLGAVERLLAADQLRLVDLLDHVSTRAVAPDELRDIDPRLDSLRNVNRPEEYHAVLRAAGFAVPPDARL